MPIRHPTIRYRRPALSNYTPDLRLLRSTATQATHLPPDRRAAILRRRGKPYHRVSEASTNATLVKGGDGCIFAIWVTNINVAIRYLKFYDVAVTPNPATDRPVFVCGIPGAAAGAGGSVAIPGAIYFDNGIGFALVTGSADLDATAVAVGDIIVSFVFR